MQLLASRVHRGSVAGPGVVAWALFALVLVVIATGSATESSQCLPSGDTCANPLQFIDSNVPAVYGGKCASGAARLASGESCPQSCPDGMSRMFGQAETLTCHLGRPSALPLECGQRKILVASAID